MSPDEREFTDEKERDDVKGGEIYHIGSYIYIYTHTYTHTIYIYIYS